jgi:hypothetical protein
MSLNIRHWDGKFLANFVNNSATRKALANGNNWSMQAAEAAAQDIKRAQQQIIACAPAAMSSEEVMLEFGDRFNEQVLYLQDSLADYNDD